MASYTVKTSAGVNMPRLIYGTAWKESRTTSLVVQAILTGFRVGEALEILQKEHNIPRESIFLQTKFTSIDGQDPNRIPYDKNAPLQDQVRQSFAKSLSNLRTTYLDSLVMHGPMRTHDKTMEVWRVFEEFHSQGKVKQLGISNFYDPRGLYQLYSEAQVKPAVLQNRFYADSGYDEEIRKFCKEKNIIYQSFWTLSANPHILRGPTIQEISKRRSITPAQAFFRFMMDIGVAPLTGTKDETHMKQDLAVLDMPSLSSDEVQSIRRELGVFE